MTRAPKPKPEIEVIVSYQPDPNVRERIAEILASMLRDRAKEQP